MEGMSAGHFIFIPAVLLFGIVIGWILGSRAAADAYAAELKRREERARTKQDAAPARQRAAG
jgi:hypothetical protein